MNKRKGAIELSANFIVIIILSIVILFGGLALFRNMIAETNNLVIDLDKQTQDNIKSMMLSNNYRVAVYPADATINNGKSQSIGVGITNIYDTKKTFTLVPKVKKFTKKVPDGGPAPGILTTYVEMLDYTVEIGPSQQVVKGVLLKMPKGAEKGQYVYTINITTLDENGVDKEYGVVQVYVNNP